MAPCTHRGMKRLFCLNGKNGLITSREVNETRCPHTCSRPCAFEKKRKKKKHDKVPAHPKHTTKSTAARRPRPLRDGAWRNTSQPLAHSRPLHRSRVCGNRPRTALAISKNDECCTYTQTCLLYTSPSPRDKRQSRMPSSA